MKEYVTHTFSPVSPDILEALRGVREFACTRDEEARRDGLPVASVAVGCSVDFIDMVILELDDRQRTAEHWQRELRKERRRATVNAVMTMVLAGLLFGLLLG